ncbi:hypothetical protein BDN72DRAFT_858239 [Pluteus cervinus]|uniref:Uncharacterized protein n=1 Tax=Pluteus cervinus TaxID=181527 RepID=A0ACD3AUR1_9AGAR|nr:hypothetical protein BDN72DRAFT_858239 [Pluteus cervinus]
MLSGLVLRSVLPGSASPLAATLSLPLIGLWEAAVLHQLSNGFDDALAYCLRLLVDFLVTRDASRAVLVVVWTGLGLLIAHYLHPSPYPHPDYDHPHRHRQSSKSIRRPPSRSRTLTPPPLASPLPPLFSPTAAPTPILPATLIQSSPPLHSVLVLEQNPAEPNPPSPILVSTPVFQLPSTEGSQTPTDADRLLSPIAEETEDSPIPVPAPALSYTPIDPSVILPIPNPLPYPRPVSTDPALRDQGELPTPTQAPVADFIRQPQLSPLSIDTIQTFNSLDQALTASEDASLPSASEISDASDPLERAEDWRTLARKKEKRCRKLEEELRRALDENRSHDALQLKRYKQDASSKAVEYHRKAARRQFQARNSTEDIPKSIDVNGLRPPEALEKVEEAFSKVLVAGSHTLKIKGLHGPGSRADVKQYVIEGMKEYVICC